MASWIMRFFSRDCGSGRGSRGSITSSFECCLFLVREDVLPLSFSSLVEDTAADVIGRKPAFNSTIFIGAIFACAVAGAQDFITFCSLWAVIGTAAGGNVPVDSIVFLEFVPQSHQWLLVTLSAWWNLGQLIVSLLSWVFLANFACSSPEGCRRQDNMGWRYVMITLGGIALVLALIRLFVFKIPESPKYLLSKGRDAEAVESVNYIARYNGKPETLTLEMMQDIDRQIYSSAVVSSTGEPVHAIPDQTEKKLSMKDILKENFKDFNMSSYRSLFAGRKMAQHSAVTFLIWLTIGIAYPLYFAFITSYLESKKEYTASSSFNHTYMVYCIVSAVGVLGPISAGFLVETRFGRRWMMAISAVLTGAFLFAYTAVGTEAADIGFQCATAILGNFEYAVMFAFTPESFPGPVRGTGTGIAATLLRLGGLVASFISTYSGFSVVPIYASAALWIVVGFFCIGLPYETHGHASL
ncbi:major facilitator superfamily domain-containing protein [Fusarium redolens]|uniref:Major facilitator superfamily domain-containing protein n=1 Tax=Fusarium redolens TaxID=48865 RepID=A0A9P9FYL3_FUSRE|nr:major facilitator superfamily domain-containing protein [Fusarium redolens]KAH7207791.1 major facilitator superfamily domain-containing protein [Fusarium redolens]